MLGVYLHTQYKNNSFYKNQFHQFGFIWTKNVFNDFFNWMLKNKKEGSFFFLQEPIKVFN